METLSLRACQCALDIQQNFKEYRKDDVYLTLHIGTSCCSFHSLLSGIAASSLTAYHVGISSSIEYVITGDAFSFLDKTVEQSKAGEVINASFVINS